MGERDAQMVDGDGPDEPTDTTPEPFTSGDGADAGPTAGPRVGEYRGDHE